MRQEESIVCPVCGQYHLALNYEVTYAYSYRLDADAPGDDNDAEFRPYLYDSRTQKAARQYIECADCKAKYPCCIQGQHIEPEQIQRVLDAAAREGKIQDSLQGGDHHGNGAEKRAGVKRVPAASGNGV